MEECNFEVEKSLSLWVKLGYSRLGIMSPACWALLDYSNLLNMQISIWVSEKIIATCQKKPKAGKIFNSHGYLYEHSTDGQQYEWTV